MRRLVLAVAAVASLLAPAPAAADPGDKAGWSIGTDPRKRVFLHWVAKADGPRLLTVACLRDVDSFDLYVDLPVASAGEGEARLALANGAARYEADGRAYPAGDGATTRFEASRDIDAAVRKELGRTFLPVLTGAGPIGLAFRGRDYPLASRGPDASLVRRFETICLGR